MITSKKLTEIRTEDLEKYPIWEYTPGKDGAGNCDYTLLKPRPDINIADPRERMLIVKAEFTTASGKIYSGFCTPYHENDIGYTQPTIIHKGHIIPFWFGIYQPGAEEIASYYSALGEDAASLFPLMYKSDVEVLGPGIGGMINGFMHLSGSSEIVLIK